MDCKLYASTRFKLHNSSLEGEGGGGKQYHHYNLFSYFLHTPILCKRKVLVSSIFNLFSVLGCRSKAFNSYYHNNNILVLGEGRKDIRNNFSSEPLFPHFLSRATFSLFFRPSHIFFIFLSEPPRNPCLPTDLVENS